MASRLKQFFSSQRNVLLLAAGTAALLLAVIIILLIVLLNNSGKDVVPDNPADKNGGSAQTNGDLSGKTDILIGKTTSLRNLKGLTLRINQIETCNPSIVSAYVAVSSDTGVVNKNFNKSDVKVYVDGQEISSFDFNPVDTAKTPIASALVIDHSGSMAGAAMTNAKTAATAYVQKLKTGDQVGVIQFSEKVETLAPVGTDKTAAANAINGIEAIGDTAIYDALVEGVAAVPNCGRKAIIVLSDGDDRMSSHTANDVTNVANRANLPIFAVGIKGLGFNPATLRGISESTGGQYLEANTPDEISELYDKIDGQLTGQFVANLKLSIKKDGQEHKLKIVSTIEGSPTSSERSFIY